MSQSHEDMPSNALLLGILAALMVLLGAAFSLVWLPHGPWKPFLAILIAGAKAALIVWIFMRARYHDHTSWLFIIGGIFWLAILFTLTFADYLTR
ncbi:MAG: cytochrome c oxidase subunit IV [Puniceicoccaceae bacterium 5H]|nr:MAG: cytochrome c oxidase subunit IV [Puniceicoccaceae bacterium 5H]